MNFESVIERAREIRQRYGEVELEKYGRRWTTEEIALGLVGDVGDLAKLIQAQAGVRGEASAEEVLDGCHTSSRTVYGQ